MLHGLVINWSSSAIETSRNRVNAKRQQKVGPLKNPPVPKLANPRKEKSPTRPWPPISTPVDIGMHKEDQQETDGPTYLEVTSKERSNPQLNSGLLAVNLNKPIYSESFIIHSKFVSRNDASVVFITEADFGNSAPSDFIPQHQDLDSLEDDLVIVVDDSDEDEEDEVHATKNVKTKDTSVPTSSSPRIMSITKEQQQALDDALVPREQCLRIGNRNYRLSTTFKPKEPTFQVALDVLSLTPFYQAFFISGSVPAIYMHELWATICLNLPGQKYEDPPFEEDILTFIRELGYPGDIKSLSDVKVDSLYQPWRTFRTIINKCLSGKETGLDQLCLSRAQIIWVIPKPKYVRRSAREKTDQAPVASPGKRLKATTKTKIVTKRSKKQFHSSHADGSCANEGTGVSLRVPDTESENDGDDFVHPKFSTHNEEERQDEEDKDEEGSDLRVQTPSHFESTNDETYDEVTQGDNIKGEELDEEETNEEEDVNELYRDVNVNLERRDTEMTDALQTNVQGTQVIEDTHVIITAVTPEAQHQSSSVSSGFISNMLNPNPDTGIDSILNLNTESTSLVDVLVTTNVEMPLSYVTSLPPPPIPLVQPQQQTPVPTPAIVPSTSLQNLPTFGSLFKFEDRVKSLEYDFSEFKQTNLFAKAVSLIPDRLRSEGQADNEDFINKIDENMKKIIKEQVKIQVKEQVTKILPKIEKSVNKQLEAEVLIRSSNEAKTSHVVAANLSELELKKILIDKMENNKSIDRSVQQKNLYKALVDAYESDKDILATYGDTVTLKRRRDDEDEDEEPSAGSNRGSKRRRAGKEPESTSAPKEKTSKSSGKCKEGSKSHQKSTGKSAQAEEPIYANKDLEELAHQEFDTGFTKDQHVDEPTQHPDGFQKPTKPPTPDRDWN
ncbi:hypothetical protein Tco_0600309 [Tanacetum coccineum]|uniref:Uncharacterized protein n=1 Tax=Tanacetum coccineum TaxID=301880 RepID=A0ABQ4WBG9_9ASTR